jgi:hypothetical protein
MARVLLIHLLLIFIPPPHPWLKLYSSIVQALLIHLLLLITTAPVHRPTDHHHVVTQMRGYTFIPP